MGTQSLVLVLVEKMNLNGHEHEDGTSDIVQREREQRGSYWETKFREGKNPKERGSNSTRNGNICLKVKLKHKCLLVYYECIATFFIHFQLKNVT